MTSNTVPIQHLRSEQEEADTRMLLPGLDATKRGETSTFIQSQDTDNDLYSVLAAARTKRGNAFNSFNVIS